MALLKEPKYLSNAKTFLTIADVNTLCLALRVTHAQLQYHINTPIYYSFQIPKKSAGTRKITAPNEELKAIHRRLNYFLQAIYLTVKPDCAHGFILKPKGYEKSHTIISNAAQHVNKKYVLN